MIDPASIPLIGGAISWGATQVDDNMVAIVSIAIILCVAMIFRPFDPESMFALTMSAISGIAALAGYEIGKRKTDGA